MTGRIPLTSATGETFQDQSAEDGHATLMRQARMIANEYLRFAVHDIDDELGPGYAKNHPELIAAFMETAAIELSAAVIARAVDRVTDRRKSRGK